MKQTNHYLFWKVLSCISLFLFLVSCGGGDDSGSVATPVDTTTTDTTTGSATTTSAGLIDDALANGDLDTETALIYKTYATFNDPRLPAEFQGDASGISDPGFLWTAINDFDTLSAATRETLAPFLIPPMYSGSWWDRQNNFSSAAQPCNPLRTDCPLLTTWKYVEGTHVNVFYQTSKEGTDLPTALQIQGALDTAWPTLTGYMGAAPDPDRGWAVPYEGPDEKLDIALVDMGPLGTTYPSFLMKTCGDASTFILINRSQSDAVSTSIHEFMHSIQFSLPVKACLSTDYKTMMESTANWAVNYILPNSQWEHQYPDSYLDDITASLLQASPPLRPYGAYLYPLYLTREVGPNKVQEAWDLARTYNQKGVMENLVNLDTVWPEFVAQLWNTAPLDKFNTWDSITDKVRMRTSDNIVLDLAGNENAEVLIMPDELPGMSAHIFHVRFNDTNIRTAAFFNGFTYKLQYETVPDIGDRVVATALAAAEKQGAHLHALFKINGAWETTLRNWTDKPYVFFAGDIPSNTVDEIVLIFSNSNSDISQTTAPYNGLPSRFWLTNIPWASSNWTGEAHFTCDRGNGVTETFDATNLNFIPFPSSMPASPVHEVTDTAYGYVLGHTLAAGNVSWSISGSSGSCSYSGNGSKSIAPGGANSFLLYPFIRSGAALRGFTLIGYDSLPPTQWDATETCEGPPSSTSSITEDHGEFMLGITPATPAASNLSTDAKSVSGNAADLGNPVECATTKGTWHLGVVP
mgnify:CR=1 FL=1